jgi:hypothetical protein
MGDLAGVLKELEQERSRLDQAIDVIGKLVGRNGTRGQTRAPRPTRTLSAAARRKISLAQKARWAKTRRAAVTPTKVHTMSRAARNKIAAAQRARWAKLKQQKKAA